MVSRSMGWWVVDVEDERMVEAEKGWVRNVDGRETVTETETDRRQGEKNKIISVVAEQAESKRGWAPPGSASDR